MFIFSQNPSDVTGFNSVTSLVNSDLLTRTACKWVRDTKIANPLQKNRNLFTMHYFSETDSLPDKVEIL